MKDGDPGEMGFWILNGTCHLLEFYPSRNNKKIETAIHWYSRRLRLVERGREEAAAGFL